jgi:hypothetical protein
MKDIVTVIPAEKVAGENWLSVAVLRIKQWRKYGAKMFSRNQCFGGWWEQSVSAVRSSQYWYP